MNRAHLLFLVILSTLLLSESPVYAGPSKLAVAVEGNASDTDFRALLEGAGLSLSSKEVKVSGKDLKAIAKQLNAAGDAEYLLLCQLKETKKRQSGAMTLVHYEARWTLVSGRSGVIWNIGNHSAKGFAGDYARASSKAKTKALEGSVKKFVGDVKKRMSNSQSLEFELKIKGLTKQGYAEYKESLEKLFASVSLEQNSINFKEGLAEFQLRAGSGTLDAIFNKLKSDSESRWKGIFEFSEYQGTVVVGQFNDPYRSIKIRIKGMDLETQRLIGPKLLEEFSGLKSLKDTRRSYDSNQETLTIHGRLKGEILDLDSLIANQSLSSRLLSDLKLQRLTIDEIHYRFKRNANFFILEFLELGPAEIAKLSVPLNTVLRSMSGVTEVEEFRQVKKERLYYRVRYQGRLYAFESAFYKTIKQKETFSGLVVAYPSQSAQLAYRFNSLHQRNLSLRFGGLNPAIYQKAGPALLDYFSTLKETKILNKRYDPSTETLSMTLKTRLSPMKVDALIWTLASKNKTLGRLVPGENANNYLSYVLSAKTPEDFAVRLLLSGLSPDAYVTVGRTLQETVRSLKGVHQLKARYSRKLWVFALDFRSKVRPFEIEERIWKVIAKKPIGKLLAPDRRIGSLIRMVVVERKQELSRLSIRVTGLYQADAQEAATKLVRHIRSLTGVKDVSVRKAYYTVSIRFWSKKGPLKMYDQIARLLASDPKLAALQDSGLEGNVICLQADNGGMNPTKPIVGKVGGADQKQNPKLNEWPIPQVQRPIPKDPVPSKDLPDLIKRLGPV